VAGKKNARKIKDLKPRKNAAQKVKGGWVPMEPPLVQKVEGALKGRRQGTLGGNQIQPPTT